MSVGNWRSHILVKCRTCKKLMGFHVKAKSVVCNTCANKQGGTE
jgi:primosomal protein N'